MSETLDFPTIEETATAAPASTAVAAPAAAPKPPAVVIKEAAIAHLTAKEPALRALAERHRDVALDLSTTKGLTAGKAARLELREQGRFDIQRARDETKDLLNGAKKDVEIEADRLIAIVKPVEDHIHSQIEAREKILADEKAERERVAAERAAGFRAKIAAITACVARSQGISAERIGNGIAAVESIVTDAATWEEFQPEAEAAKTETLAAMLAMHASTLAAEQAAAALEAQRVENERLAAEQKAEADRLAAERAEFERQQAELKAQQEAFAKLVADQKAAADAEAARLQREAQQEESKRIQRENDHAAALRTSLVDPEPNTPVQDIQPVLKVEAAMPDTTDRDDPASTSPSVGSTGAGQATDVAPSVVYTLASAPPCHQTVVPAAEASMIKLGELWDMLGLTDRENFLASLGFTATPAPKGTGKLYRADDVPAIRRAIAKRMTDAAEFLEAA